MRHICAHHQSLATVAAFVPWHLAGKFELSSLTHKISSSAFVCDEHQADVHFSNYAYIGGCICVRVYALDAVRAAAVATDMIWSRDKDR